MDSLRYKLMYGRVLDEPMTKAAGEGSRGGKVVGHTATGKPIYDKDGHSNMPASRKPFPGEEQHKMPVMTQQQKAKTFMPNEGTEAHYSDSPNLKAYKNILRTFKKMGMDFAGHITYDPKTDQVKTLTPQGAESIKKIISDYQAGQKKSA